MTNNEMALMASIAVDMQKNEVNSVLDKIRAEVEKQEKWLFLAGLTTYNVDIAFSSIKAVLAESEK